jgi:Stress responsive A/B Barrel Domain
MIAHLVLFKPRAAMPPAERLAILDSLMASLKQLPMVRDCRVGRRIRHGLPGYEQAMREDYEFALVLEFDGVDGLREYLRHPAHAALGGAFSSGADDALAYDYEMMSLDEMLTELRSTATHDTGA